MAATIGRGTYSGWYRSWMKLSGRPLTSESCTSFQSLSVWFSTIAHPWSLPPVSFKSARPAGWSAASRAAAAFASGAEVVPDPDNPSVETLSTFPSAYTLRVMSSTARATASSRDVPAATAGPVVGRVVEPFFTLFAASLITSR